MHPAKNGEREVVGKSVVLKIVLPFEQSAIEYMDMNKLHHFDHFFVRKTMFAKYAQGFVIMPPGFGTLDEYFELATWIDE